MEFGEDLDILEFPIDPVVSVGISHRDGVCSLKIAIPKDPEEKAALTLWLQGLTNIVKNFEYEEVPRPPLKPKHLRVVTEDPK